MCTKQLRVAFAYRLVDVSLAELKDEFDCTCGYDKTTRHFGFGKLNMNTLYDNDEEHTCASHCQESCLDLAKLYSFRCLARAHKLPIFSMLSPKACPTAQFHRTRSSSPILSSNGQVSTNRTANACHLDFPDLPTQLESLQTLTRHQSVQGYSGNLCVHTADLIGVVMGRRSRSISR